MIRRQPYAEFSARIDTKRLASLPRRSDGKCGRSKGGFESSSRFVLLVGCQNYQRAISLLGEGAARTVQVELCMTFYLRNKRFSHFDKLFTSSESGSHSSFIHSYSFIFIH